SKAPLAASSAAAFEPGISARSARRSPADLFFVTSIPLVTAAIMVPSIGPTAYTDHLTRPAAGLGEPHLPLAVPGLLPGTPNISLSDKLQPQRLQHVLQPKRRLHPSIHLAVGQPGGEPTKHVGDSLLNVCDGDGDGDDHGEHLPELVTSTIPGSTRGDE